MGSKSDMPLMEKAAQELEERGIRHEMRVMSAHRDPDTVADYAKNARMRGLRVIIAGAGLAAALPGVVAAHTDLPVIGVPLTSKTSVAGGLDALLAIAQMPPGVPVAAVGVDNPKNAAVLAARILERVIERYTRPEMGAVWSERRKLDTWLQVELAVVDALAEQGVVPEEDAATIRDRAQLHASRRSRSASRSPTTTWRPSWTWWPARSARRAAGCTTASPRRTCSTPRSASSSRRRG